MADNTTRFNTTDGDELRSDDLGTSKVNVAKIATGLSNVDGGLATRQNPVPVENLSIRELWTLIGLQLRERTELLKKRFPRRRRRGGSFPVTIGGGGIVPVIIGGISPALGNDRGGTAVTITGSGFTGHAGATVGGVALTSFTVVTDTTITGVTGANAVGLADVVIGTTTLTGGYEYLDATSRGTLLWWWRADKGATTSLGTLTALAEQAVASIGDDLAYNALGNAPGYFTADPNFNGRASWGTSGADDEMLLTNESFASPGGSGNAYTVYHVLRVPTSASGNNVYLRLGPGGSSANGVALLGVAGGTFTAFMGGAGLGTVIPVDTTIVHVTVYNGASSAIYMNHYSAPDATGTIDIGFPLNGLETGTYWDSESGQYVEAEIAIYAGVHSTATLQAIASNYLGDAYGISVT